MINRPLIFKPHDKGIEYVGDFPEHYKHCWMVDFRNHSVFYPAKPTRKQVRSLVDWVNKL